MYVTSHDTEQQMDTPECDEEPSGDQDARIAPKEERSFNQTTQKLVLPEGTSCMYVSSTEKTSTRGVEEPDSTTLVGGVDSRPLLFQGMKGSADQSQEQYIDAYSENCEGVQTPKGENQELREKQELQQVEKFVPRQRELELRLRNVMKENMQLKEDTKRLEDENKKLKSQSNVTLLESQVANLRSTRGELFCVSSDSA